MSTSPLPEEPAAPAPGKRVLLAEDEALFHTAIGEFLEHKGYTVLHAMNGEEAVRIARAESPDVILMDVMMPRMTGTEAMRELKRSVETAGIPIVAVTAAVYRRTLESTLAEGFDGYVPKPFTAAQILAEVARLTGG
ncbi:MAG: response regulator [Gemmatimonadetes bacterium]|nr:response regulator [Gemmatimonadota bacterium]